MRHMNRIPSDGLQESFGSDRSHVVAPRRASWSPSFSEYSYNNGQQGGTRRDEMLVMPARRAFLSPIEPLSIRPNSDNKTKKSCIDSNMDNISSRGLHYCSYQDFNMGDWPLSETEVIWPQYDYRRESCMVGCKDKVSSTRRSSLCSYVPERGTDKQTGTCMAKKSVCFAPERSNSTAIIMCLDDYSAKEHHACWYSREELDTMLSRALPSHRDTRWNAGANLDHMHDNIMWSQVLPQRTRD